MPRLSLNGGLRYEDVDIWVSNSGITGLDSKGDKPAGVNEASNRSKHRVNAGLRYDLFENTTLLLDYKYQDVFIMPAGHPIRPLSIINFWHGW